MSKIVVRRRRACCPGQLDMLVQLEQQYVIELAAKPQEDAEDPLIVVPIIQRLVSASAAGPAIITGPRSIFDMATAPISLKAKPQASRPATTRIERIDGVVRCTRILPQDTDEWQEREAARRARQKPPRPPKAALTVGVKLAAVRGNANRAP